MKLEDFLFTVGIHVVPGTDIDALELVERMTVLEQITEMLELGELEE